MIKGVEVQLRRGRWGGGGGGGGGREEIGRRAVANEKLS